MTNHYRVIWEIDIEADSHEQAAKIALDVQRNPNSCATVFTVLAETADGEGYGSACEVDL